ncbi:hypothetical protein M501DRAFT_1033446 [Patellaria atrata CBS 101060]|uniref:Uncharacterized protein n=1 Tax=Patellaria atrata CBS 101060 TaxID=1346257 RepID=A0A9P4S5Z9_9PEZI|nr:hypothetical protein M501DRAFT_1033446 [Patellaria atrata CBS 101060]
MDILPLPEEKAWPLRLEFERYVEKFHGGNMKVFTWRLDRDKWMREEKQRSMISEEVALKRESAEVERKMNEAKKLERLKREEVERFPGWETMTREEWIMPEGVCMKCINIAVDRVDGMLSVEHHPLRTLAKSVDFGCPVCCVLESLVKGARERDCFSAEKWFPAEVQGSNGKNHLSYLLMTTSSGGWIEHCEIFWAKSRRWISSCVSTHPKCNQVLNFRCPTRLIDIRGSNPRIWRVRGNSLRYAALSYCWGDSSLLKASKENISTLKRGINMR